MNETLYSVLGLKSKNSIYKSVFITGKFSDRGLPIVEVEPWDNTFLNAVSTATKYSNTVDKIITKVVETIGSACIVFYTDEWGTKEYEVYADRKVV